MTPRTPKKSQQIREERQTQILEAALKLFAEKGLHNTKVSEIAAQAGVSQGTVYWYFDSKEELFEAAFMSQFDTLIEPFYEIAADEERSPANKLMEIAEVSIDLFDNTEAIFVMLQAMATREVANILTYDFREYYVQFKAILVPLFEEMGDPDPDATASMFIALLDGLMFQRLLGPDMFSRDQVLAQIERKFNLYQDS